MSLPLFTILYCYLIRLTSSQWSFSHVCGPAGEIEYSVNIQQTTTYIDIVYHGTNRWVSLGFGKTTMYGAYAMVFGTECERCSTIKMMDYWLTKHDDGDEIKECNGETCSQLISYSMENGITIINASIDNDAGSTKTYKFDPTGSTPVEAMCAWGKDPTMEYDDEHCDGCWGTGTFTYSTTSDTNLKVLSKTKLGSSSIYLEMSLKKSTSLMDVTIYGPTDRWFGIAWGNHGLGDGLIYDASAGKSYDYYLGGMSASAVVSDTSQDWVIISDSIINNEQVLHATRTFDTGDSAQDLIFDMTLDTVTFLVAQSDAADYTVDGHGSNRWTVAVTFDGANTIIPTTTTIGATPFIDPNTIIKEFPKTEIGSNSGIEIAIKMDKNSEIFEIELYGPIGKWFGVLFDSHKGGDAVIYTTDYDGLDTAGVNVDYSVKSKSSADITKDAIQNWNVIELTQVNGKQKIVAWRNFNTGDVDNDYIIDYNTNTLTLLVAYSGSNELKFGYHGSYFWKATIDLSASNETVITSTPTTTTYVDIKTFPLTQIGDGSGIFVSITMNKLTEIYEIELHGPTDRWFGVVWDNHYAGEAFIYVLNDSNHDYICNGKADSDIIQDPVQNWNVHQNIVINGQRQIVASRVFDTGDTTNDYPFDFTKNSVTLLVAHGVDNGPLSYHSSYRWVADVIFDGANVTIPRVTEFIDPNATVKVFPKTEIGYNSGIEIAIKMDKNSEIFEIELLGPIGKWFGVLFDSHNGGDSLIYTSGYDGLDTAGVNVDYSVKSIFADDIKKDDIQNWNVTELSQIDGKQKIVAWRKFNTGDMDNDYIIDYNANTLTLLIAHCDEDSLIFGSHGQYKWKDVIDLAAGTIDSVISEDETSLMPITMDEENVDIKMFELSEIGDDSGIFVSITMKKSTETYEIELHGPTDRWFGIIWNNHYAGDAFIYVLDGTDPDYKCSGKAESDLIKDTIQSWIIHENIEINGQRQIVASRAFDTGDREHDYPFDFMQNSVNLLVAHGVDSSDSLSYHGSYRWEATINMLSGGLLEKSIETYYLLNHEIFMLIGFGIIVPFALLLFRFKLIFFQCYSSFWIIQIVRSMFVLGTISVWFGLIEKIFHGIEENNLILFDTIHSYIGLILISIWSLSMILQYILYRNKKEHEFRLFDNPISCIFIILLCFGQITLGLIQIQISKVYFMIFIVYCGIYVVIYIMLEIYQGSLLQRLIKRRASKFQFEINLAKISINNNNKADTNIKSDITSPNSTMSPLNSPQQNTNELFTTPNIIHVQTSDDDENFEEKQLEDYHVGDYDEQYEVYYD